MSVSEIVPDDISKDISSRLPVKSLIRFICVSKGLSDVVHEPHFRQIYAERNNGKIFAHYPSHFALYKDDDERFIELTKLLHPPQISQIQFKSIQVVGISNGLICLSSSLNDDMYVWNPTIRKARYVPRPLISPNLTTKLVLDFGFIPQSQDYMLLKFLGQKYERFSTMMEIYSLRTNSWTRIGDKFGWEVLWGWHAMKAGIFHWIASSEKDNKFVLSFDCTNEAFGEITLPESCKQEFSVLNLTVLNGLIAIFTQCSENVFPLHIWVWNQGWSIQYTFTDILVDFESPLGFLKTGELLLKLTDTANHAVAYHPKFKRTRTIAIPAKVSAFTFCQESLDSVMFF